MRLAEIVITLNGVDVSTVIENHLHSMTYVSNAAGRADDLQIVLKESAGLWQGAQALQKGVQVHAKVYCSDWKKPGDGHVLDCGRFTIDEIVFAGAPDIVTVKCVSAYIASSFRQEKKSRAWENMTLELILSDIARENQFDYFYFGPVHEYKRKDQRGESDLSFLSKLASEVGMGLKVISSSLVMYDENEFEQDGIHRNIVKGESCLQSFTFTEKSHEIYNSATAAYFDPEEKAEKRFTYTPANPPAGGQILKINKRYESLAQAETGAQKELRQKNKQEHTGSLVLMGDTQMLTSFNVQVSGFAIYDGKYFIDTSTHKIDKSSGYTTTIGIRKVLGF